MTQPVTESYIKKHLDGWFMRYSPNLDKFERKSVPPDFVPAHENYYERQVDAGRSSWKNREGRGRGQNKYPPLTDKLKQQIIHQRSHGLTILGIHHYFQVAGEKVTVKAIREVLGRP